ncbi:MAG: amidohydrolase family protein, partial [Clostridia bacterium]|nr:amidohydrolase family protein [Clostridia bacterium]
GINANTKNPSAGNITREADGYPAGLFQEMSAIALIKNGIPGYDYSVEQYKDTLRYYQKNLANNYGVTLINDVLFTENAREAYKELAESGELTLRVRGVYHIDNDKFEENFAEATARKGKDDINDLFKINTIKVFIEGEFAMCEPYERKMTESLGLPADYTGNPLWQAEDNKKIFSDAMKEGFQIHAHAMGDKSVKQTIESYEYAQKIHGNENRNIIAHLMAVKPEDIEKMGQLKLIGACQPRWMLCDTDLEGFCVPYFSKDRAYDFYPNKRLRDAGCVVAYGTDFPVTPPPNPFHEIQCGMTRSVFPDAPDFETYKGLVLGPDGDKLRDAVTLEESIQSLTINGAYQNFLENVTGSIEIGKSAELVILDCDIENIPMEEIYKINAVTTIFKGKIVFDS